VSEHTKEPWAIHPLMARIVPVDHISRPIGADDDAEVDLATYAQEICAMHWPDRNRSEEEVFANARRIVACVNACAGLDIEILEAITTSFSEEYSDMLKQRDKLLEALSVITLNATVQPDASMNGSSDIYAVPICDIESARKLIAEVEASK
jgi:hypothetical protein